MAGNVYPPMVQARVDAMEEAWEKAESCPNKGSGCFGDSPGVFVSMLYTDDSEWRANVNRAAIASAEAGEKSLTQGDIRFTESRGDVNEEVNLSDFPRGSLTREAGRCAYKCARNGGSCPIPRQKP